MSNDFNELFAGLPGMLNEAQKERAEKLINLNKLEIDESLIGVEILSYQYNFQYRQLEVYFAIKYGDMEVNHYVSINDDGTCDDIGIDNTGLVIYYDEIDKIALNRADVIERLFNQSLKIADKNDLLCVVLKRAKLWAICHDM